VAVVITSTDLRAAIDAAQAGIRRPAWQELVEVGTV
jgi:hypothetical protein